MVVNTEIGDCSVDHPKNTVVFELTCAIAVSETPTVDDTVIELYWVTDGGIVIYPCAKGLI